MRVRPGWVASWGLCGLLSMGRGAAAGPEASEEGAAPRPVSVSVLAGQEGVHAGETFDVAAVIEVQGGWHVNAHTPREEWLIPTEIWLDDSTAVQVVHVAWPSAKDIRLSFSDVPMAVYEGTATIGVRLRVPKSARAGSTLTLAGGVGYQACNDETCLAPERVPFTVQVPVLAPPPAEPDTLRASSGLAAMRPAEEAGRAPEGAVGSPNDAASEVAREEPRGVGERLGGVLERNFRNPILAILLTLGLGLLSAATPCVYPMIPITVRILMGRGAGNVARGRAHAFLYFLGIVIVYALLGLIAGVTGGGFNEIMRIPVVILAFAILFAFLGLSMFGLFEIQIPASIASRVDGSVSSRSGYLGTALMGVGAGLVVSPCVGPVVVFILSQIATQIAAAQAAGGGALSTAGPLAYGSFLMAGYGAGLGVPFLVVGLFSTRAMARPGAWMTFVRVGLGVLILYFAYQYFLKAADTAGIDRSLSSAIVRGVVMIFLAVFWGVFRTRAEEGPHAGWHNVRLASMIVLLIVGVFYLWTGLSRSGLVARGNERAPASAVAQAPGVEDSHGLLWHRDYARATAEAREKRLPLFVDFYANWCANCKVFSKEAAEEGPFRTALESIVRAKVYDTDDVFRTFQADPRFPELKVGLPFFLILSAEGEVLWKGTDYHAHDTFMREIERAKAREGGATS